MNVNFPDDMGFRVDFRNLIRSVVGYVGLFAVRTDRDPLRILSYFNGCSHRVGFSVDDRDGIGAAVGDVGLPSIRGHGDPHRFITDGDRRCHGICFWIDD